MPAEPKLIMPNPDGEIEVELRVTFRTYGGDDTALKLAQDVKKNLETIFHREVYTEMKWQDGWRTVIREDRNAPEAPTECAT